MKIITISSQAFNQNMGEAKRTTFDKYQHNTVAQQNIVDAIALPEAAEIEFEHEKLKRPFFHPEDFA